MVVLVDWASQVKTEESYPKVPKYIYQLGSCPPAVRELPLLSGPLNLPDGPGQQPTPEDP